MMFKKPSYLALGIFLLFVVTAWFVWFLLENERIPNNIRPTNGMVFDYIIVGAGTAGSVLANRLSADHNRSVLLIEAGHTFGVISKIPLLTTLSQNTKNDWAFKSQPQQYSSRGLLDNRQSLPRGKGLGGSSQLNYLLHFEGNRRDFDNWEKIGIHGWDYETITNYIKRPNKCARCMSSIFAEDSNFCFCAGAPLCNESTIEDKIWHVPTNYSKLSEAFFHSSHEFSNDHLNFRFSKYNIKNGIRWGVYENLLKPSLIRDNLKTLTNTVVEKIVLENDRAKAVKILYLDKSGYEMQLEIKATEEIILSAGAFQTPQILQLSGIGNAKHLKRIKVKQLVESPKVGYNLHDHMNFPLYVSITEVGSLTVDKIMSLKEIVRYLATGKGIFGNFGVIGHIDAPNDIFGIGIFGTGAVDEKALKDLSNFKQEAFRSTFPLYYNSTQEGFIALSTCHQPLSRGIVRARTNNIRDTPLINPNYLHRKEDVDCIVRAVRKAVEIIKSEPFQNLGAKIHWPKLRNCANFGPFHRDFISNEPSDRYLACIIRTVGLTSHHPGGTCAMGASKYSVIDNQLRVRGVTGLRIVDASILPTPISGTPNTVLAAMAQRAADIIIKSY